MRGLPERAQARTTYFQIPAKAGTTKRALADFKAGVMRSFPERAKARTTYFQIPAKAGTTIRALAGFKAGVMRGFPERAQARTTYSEELLELFGRNNECRDFHLELFLPLVIL